MKLRRSSTWISSWQKSQSLNFLTRLSSCNSPLLEAWQQPIWRTVQSKTAFKAAFTQLQIQLRHWPSGQALCKDIQRNSIGSHHPLPSTSRSDYQTIHTTSGNHIFIVHRWSQTVSNNKFLITETWEYKTRAAWISNTQLWLRTWTLALATRMPIEWTSKTFLLRNHKLQVKPQQASNRWELTGRVRDMLI